ncbi:MAG: type II secretion system protein [Verrucomicrobiales bacterium]|nr:type II secretion system protein [Verrucomicrobiales bacterium]
MLVQSNHLGTKTYGLSLTELLLVVAVIGVIASIAIPAVSNMRESAKTAAATQNAKNIAQMSEALAALGVAHVIPDSMGGAEATARLLREGVVVPEGPMAGERFILSGMRESDIEETAEYLRIEYDATNLRLVFSEPVPDQTRFDIFSGSRLWCARHPSIRERSLRESDAGKALSVRRPRHLFQRRLLRLCSLI